jgi:hypothetical protein
MRAGGQEGRKERINDKKEAVKSGLTTTLKPPPWKILSYDLILSHFPSCLSALLPSCPIQISLNE